MFLPLQNQASPWRKSRTPRASPFCAFLVRRPSAEEDGCFVMAFKKLRAPSVQFFFTREGVGRGLNMIIAQQVGQSYRDAIPTLLVQLRSSRDAKGRWKTSLGRNCLLLCSVLGHNAFILRSEISCCSVGSKNCVSDTTIALKLLWCFVRLAFLGKTVIASAPHLMGLVHDAAY